MSGEKTSNQKSLEYKLWIIHNTISHIKKTVFMVERCSKVININSKITNRLEGVNLGVRPKSPALWKTPHGKE